MLFRDQDGPTKTDSFSVFANRSRPVGERAALRGTGIPSVRISKVENGVQLAASARRRLAPDCHTWPTHQSERAVSAEVQPQAASSSDDVRVGALPDEVRGRCARRARQARWHYKAGATCATA